LHNLQSEVQNQTWKLDKKVDFFEFDKL